MKAAWKSHMDNASDKGASTSIGVIRNSLKSELMHNRRELTIVGWLPICPICRHPAQTPDMHEAILTRGDVQGLPIAQRAKIFVRANCVLVHPGKCHIKAATKEGTRKCVLQVLEKEGLAAIMQWLAGMESVLPQELLNEAIDLVQRANEQRNLQVRGSKGVA